MSIFRKAIVIFAFAFFIFSGTVSAAEAPVALKGKETNCILLEYDFVSKAKDFPGLKVPDNALLLLAGEKGSCEPMSLSVEQNGKSYPVLGSLSDYVWGVFHTLYFDTAFDKFSPFKIRSNRSGDKAELSVEGAVLNSLAGQSKKEGKIAWVDPVTDERIKDTDPLDLAELLSYGRFLEYADEALYLEKDGGLPKVRREARSALEAGDALQAACLFTMAIKWAESSEPAETRNVSMFQDWVFLARSFRAMKRPAAAVIAYDQALKIKNDTEIAMEREQAKSEIAIPVKKTPPPYRSGLSDAELEAGKHGSIPIPENERDVIEGGVKANGVYLGDHVDIVIAQCGEPSEFFSSVIVYDKHPICPQSIFISPKNRVYSIQTYRGKIPKVGGIGDSMDSIIKKIGQPDRKEAIADENGKSAGTRWVYLKMKAAFIDMDGDGKIDAIDVFDYSYIL